MTWSGGRWSEGYAPARRRKGEEPRFVNQPGMGTFALARPHVRGFVRGSDLGVPSRGGPIPDGLPGILFRGRHRDDQRSAERRTISSGGEPSEEKEERDEKQTMHVQIEADRPGNVKRPSGRWTVSCLTHCRVPATILLPTSSQATALSAPDPWTKMQVERVFCTIRWAHSKSMSAGSPNRFTSA